MTSETIRPSRAWYAVAAAIFLVSLIPTYLLGRAAVGSVSSDVTALSSHRATLDGTEKAVFSRTPGAASDISSCTATPVGGGPAVKLNRGIASVTVSSGGDSWERVGIVPGGTAAGAYAIVCKDSSGATVGAALGVGRDPNVGSFVFKVIIALIIPAIAALVALAIAVVTGLRRSRVRKRTQPASGAPFFGAD
ncbi:MAG: hypothetical protein ACRDP1_14470 [Nocardioidaceae bacterium]